MPEFVSLRSFTVTSTMGHSATFEAGVPKNIPMALVPAAMEAGCVPATAADAPFHEDATRAKVEFTGSMRTSMIYLALQDIIEKNAVKEFDGSGVPRVTAVEARIGYDVTRKEVTDVYQQLLQCKSDNKEFVLAPNADNVMLVIKAEDRAELTELAKEFGIDDDSCKGLQLRELRKLLLVRLNGTAA